jgi:ATP-dependent DNA helicase RecQ
MAEPRSRRWPTGRRVQSVVRDVFGLSELRPGQRAVIDSVLAGQHTLAIMPTGAGKSLCYQVPAMIKPGMTVVVSPLIALMKDQFEKLASLGLDAVQVNSAIPADEVRRAQKKIGRRSVEFIFTTPEQLASPELRALIGRATVDLLVIDEAHCISQWGHDFRPAYLESLRAIKTLGHPTVLALTATAPPDVADDIARQLNVGPVHVVNTGAHRPNLRYSVRPVASDLDKDRHLLDILRRADGATIVYCATIRHVEHVARQLALEGVEAESYHGRMRAPDRASAQDRFMSGEARLIVATNAFGMGIDRQDIRAVVHYDLPASVDVYYQESGRAGRDGAPAECILLFQRSDRALQTYFMAGRYPAHEDFLNLVEALRYVGERRTVTFEDIRDSSPGIAVGKLRVMLSVFKDARLLRQRQGSRFELSPRLFTEPVEPLAHAYEQRRQKDREKLEQMVVYGQTALCRTHFLVEALGEPVAWERCDSCDNCTGVAVRAEAVAAGAA